MALGNVSYSPGNPDDTGSGVDSKELEAVRNIAVAAQEAAATANSKLATYDDRITKAESAVTSATESVGQMSETVSSMASTVAANQKAVQEASDKATQASKDLTELQEEVDKLQTEGTGKGNGVVVETSTPAKLDHGKMVMVGKNLYVGGPDSEVIQVVLTNSGETIQVEEGEVLYYNGAVYFGDGAAGKVSPIFTSTDDKITVLDAAPTTLKIETVATYNGRIYVGDVDDKPVEIVKAVTPFARPTSGAEKTLIIYGGRIFFQLSDNSWALVGHASGVGYGSESEPNLGIYSVGDMYLFGEYAWRIVNLTDEWFYLLLAGTSNKTKFGESTTYEGSTLAGLSEAIAATFTEEQTSLLGSITVEGVTAKVNSIPNARLTAYSYLSDPKNRTVAGADGNNVGWWTASSVTEGKIRVVGPDGAYIDAEPTEEYYYRPFIAVKRT